MEQAAVADKPSLTLRRQFPVAPEKVWRAWTDPKALARWFGPGGPDPISVADLDVRIGGSYRIVFGGAQGTEHEVQGTYKVVEPYRKLAFTWCWPRSTPERVSLVSITLQAVADGRATEMVFRHEQHFDATVRDNHQRGWSETFVKLDQFLRGDAKS